MAVWRPENHPELWSIVPHGDKRPFDGWHAKATTDQPALRTDRYEPREPSLKLDPLGDALKRARQRGRQ